MARKPLLLSWHGRPYNDCGSLMQVMNHLMTTWHSTLRQCDPQKTGELVTLGVGTGREQGKMQQLLRQKIVLASSRRKGNGRWVTQIVHTMICDVASVFHATIPVWRIGRDSLRSAGSYSKGPLHKKI